MGPLVSIIILPFEDDAYLERCVNSIKRQTYKNINISVMGSAKDVRDLGENVSFFEVSCNDVYKNINEVIEAVRGDYILFCEVTAMMTPRYISELLLNAKNQMSVGTILKKNNQIINESVMIDYSIVGKLFDKSVIVNEMIRFDDNSICPEYTFVSMYMQCCLGINHCSKAFFYIKEDRFNWNKEADFEQIKLFLEKQKEVVSHNCLENSVVTIFNESEKLSNVDKLKLAIWLIVKYEDCPACNLEIAEKHLKSIYERDIQGVDENLWKEWCYYFCSIKNPYMLTSILGVFNLKKEHIELMCSCSFREFIYFKDKINVSKKEEAEISGKEILEELKELKKKIENIKIEAPACREKEIIYLDNKLHGVELGEYVLEEYRTGKLGFGYIVKFFVAYVKHKFR